jgi:hypothetical protein
LRKIVAQAAAAVAVVLSLSACRSAPAGAFGGGPAGALSANAAVQEFLAAAHEGRWQMMASLFGTSSGSITRRDEPNDVEKRMRTLQCYLTHDAARVVDDAPGQGAKRQLTVELRKQNLVRRTTFTAVPGSGDRWYVEAFDINAVADLCRP